MPHHTQSNHGVIASMMDDSTTSATWGSMIVIVTTVTNRKSIDPPEVCFSNFLNFELPGTPFSPDKKNETIAFVRAQVERKEIDEPKYQNYMHMSIATTSKSLSNINPRWGAEYGYFLCFHMHCAAEQIRQHFMSSLPYGECQDIHLPNRFYCLRSFRYHHIKSVLTTVRQYVLTNLRGVSGYPALGVVPTSRISWINTRAYSAQ
jgi:hypothetical protein